MASPAILIVLTEAKMPKKVTAIADAIPLVCPVDRVSLQFTAGQSQISIGIQLYLSKGDVRQVTIKLWEAKAQKAIVDKVIHGGCFIHSSLALERKRLATKA